MIQTNRCVLRVFQEKDLDVLMQYRNNDTWMEFQGFKNQSKDEYREALIISPNIEKGIQYAIADINTDELLGDVYLSKKETTISVGYTIHPNHARKGYITEVMHALLSELEKIYSDCEIIAMTDKHNVASINLLLKLGFVYDEWIEKWQSQVYIYKG